MATTSFKTMSEMPQPDRQTHTNLIKKIQTGGEWKKKHSKQGGKKSTNRADFGIQVGNQKQDMCWVWPQGDHL
jgi:hypothetical protein